MLNSIKLKVINKNVLMEMEIYFLDHLYKEHAEIQKINIYFSCTKSYAYLNSSCKLFSIFVRD